MNRKNLTSAVIAGLAGAAGIAATAQAVNLNPDGLGQVLIYPYYTTRAGNQTLLSVVNTTDQAKAVKVRFLEGKNTREVLDFNLYLSPYDVWAAALVDGSAVDTTCVLDTDLTTAFDFGNPEGGQCGIPHIVINDASCTVPYLFESASTLPGLQAFLPFGFNQDGGNTDISRASEGHFEMIEMGTLVDGSGSAAAATHDSSGTPANCDTLVGAWTEAGTGPNGAPPGYWQAAPSTDIEPPSGGLFGGAAVINPANGYMFSYDAEAINNFQSDAPVNDLTTLHAFPGSTNPGLNSGDVLDATIFLDDGTTLTSNGLTRGVDAVSYVFMHDQLLNEYNVEPSIAGETEWVITFPTKHFYVYAPEAGSGVPIAPFTQEWIADNNGTACEPVLLENVYDREEQTAVDPTNPGDGPVVSPQPPGIVTPFVNFELCYETNVIVFQGTEPGVPPMLPEAASPILGALNTTNFLLPEGFTSGWAILDLAEYATPGGIETRTPLGGATAGNLEGLPTIGFQASKYENANAQPGIQAFYGGIYNHKGTRRQSS